MKKNIAIIILIIIIAIVSLAFFIREGINLSNINRLEQSMLEKEADHEIEVVEMIFIADGIFKHYQKLLGDYRRLAYEIKPDLIGKDLNLQIKYRGKFEASAYTSAECGFVTKIGMDLRENYSRYFNIAAVDPNEIPLGSLLITEIGSELYFFVAADTGGLIKGKRLDLYFDNGTENAIDFGRKNIDVWVVDNKVFKWEKDER
jgi:3D (Asp-Asp-Asp) domain-containing protein